jgi:hypothetical protein
MVAHSDLTVMDIYKVVEWNWAFDILALMGSKAKEERA